MPRSPVQAGFHVEPGSGNFPGAGKMVPGGVEVHQAILGHQPYDMTLKGRASIRVNEGYDLDFTNRKKLQSEKKVYISWEYIGNEVEGVISQVL